MFYKRPYVCVKELSFDIVCHLLQDNTIKIKEMMSTITKL